MLFGESLASHLSAELNIDINTVTNAMNSFCRKELKNKRARYIFSTNCKNILINYYNKNKCNNNDLRKEIKKFSDEELCGVSINDEFLEAYLAEFEVISKKDIPINILTERSLNYAVYNTEQSIERKKCVECHSSVKDDKCVNPSCLLNQKY